MATSFDRRRPLRWFEWTALAIGAALLSWVAVSTVHARLFERTARREFEAAVRAPAPEPRPAMLAPGEVLGIVEIPRLGFSSVVVEGDGDEMLSVAVGHLPDTPLPWQPGNTAIAGHRDGYFRPLRRIRIGDQVRLRTRYGTFVYDITKTTIVLPSDLSVLAPTPQQTLTLVTCHPFSYVGHAPNRFVIHARMRSSGKGVPPS